MAGKDDGSSVAGVPRGSTKPGTLYVGTAGFSYPDWIGPVYPAAPGRRVPSLALLAGWVDLLEVNVSHYRIPAPRLAQGWLRATEARPGFRFTAKAWRGYTHGPERPSRADHRAMLEFLSTLAGDGRLLAVLAQFPPSFRASTRTEAYVHRLAGHFEGFRLAVEMRDVSWDRDEVREGLAARGIAWVVADLPPGPRSVPPRDVAQAGLGYVRLHGRSPAWYERGVGRDRRYDYLYEPEEVRAWAERIRRLQDLASNVVVVANNHFSGKALVNAIELKALTGGGPVGAPASLVAAYPRLLDVVAG